MRIKYSKLSNEKLGNILVQDELFDFTLYQGLQKQTTGDLANMLGKLSEIEIHHYEYWKAFYKSDISELSFGKRTKLNILLGFARLFGTPAIYLITEANERFAVQRYLDAWERYKDNPKVAPRLKEILIDEFQNQEDIIGDSIQKKINAEKVRNIFLGFNDGLVELLGAVSGFYIAFSQMSAVIIAGFTVAIAGAISMAAGVFVSESSDREISNIENEKLAFLGKHTHSKILDTPLTLGLIVGFSYIIGAMIPIAPALFGSKSIFISAFLSAAAIIIISYILSFLSGMEIRRRIIMNLGIIVAAVIITSIIGTIIKNIFGVVV